ncbi:MAG: efflux RND transporter periplasmic adaptor subunit [Blastocatellia bacterium]
MNEQHPPSLFNREVRQARKWGGVRSWLVAALVLALLAFGIYKLRPKPEKEEEPEAATVSVQVAKVERETITAETKALGTIFPREQATISAKISSQIKSMPLLKNRVVRAGDVIATLESRDLQAQRAEAVKAFEEARLNARALSTGTIPQARAQEEKTLTDARANVAVARAQYQRRQDLRTQGGLAEKDVEAARLALTLAEDELRLAESNAALRASTINRNDLALAQSRIEQAQQRLATLDAQLSYATIRAPFGGVITDQFAYEGEFATPGGKLVNLADISEVIVKAPFADTVAAQLNTGSSATVQPADLPGQELKGKVSLVSRASDPANRTVEVWINLPNRDGRLRANSAAQVLVGTRTAKDALVVPTAAVTLETSNGDEGTVMVVDAKSVARERKVTIGIRTPEKIEIIKGLNEGETVVTEGNYALPDGTKVQVGEERKEEMKDKDEKDDKQEKSKAKDEDEKGADKLDKKPKAKE